MKHKRTFLLLVLLVILALLSLMVLAQSTGNQDSAETLREQALAWAAEHEEIASLLPLSGLSSLDVQYPLLVSGSI